MVEPITELAISYVHRCFPQFADPTGLLQIRDAFASLVSGESDADNVSSLLLHYCGGTQPLDHILAILQASDQPLTNADREAHPDSFSSIRKKPRPWSPAEDVRLLAGIYRFGVDNWAPIAQFVGNGRTRAQCVQRWVRGLDPRISKEQWSDDEERRLLELVREDGAKGWTKIAAGLGNRSDVQCRYHFRQMQRERRVPHEFADLISSETVAPVQQYSGIPMLRQAPVIFEPQGMGLALGGGRPTSQQNERLIYSAYPQFAFAPRPPEPIARQEPRRKHSERRRRVPKAAKQKSRVAKGPDSDTVVSKGTVPADVERLAVRTPLEGIDFSVPSDDEGEDRGVFGKSFCW
jgi:hypothetical protein